MWQGGGGYGQPNVSPGVGNEFNEQYFCKDLCDHAYMKKIRDKANEGPTSADRSKKPRLLTQRGMCC